MRAGGDYAGGMARPTARSRVLGLALVLGLAAGTAACGEREGTPRADSSASSKTSPTTRPTPTIPDCGQVWKAGQRFPEDYRGCKAAGKMVAPAPIVCESGQLIYRYQDRFYATDGAPIRHSRGPLRDDPQYQRTYRACTA